MKASKSQIKAIKAKSNGTGAIQFYDVGKGSKIQVPRGSVTFTHNKRGKPVMIAKGYGTRRDGSKFDLHRIGHA